VKLVRKCGASAFRQLLSGPDKLSGIYLGTAFQPAVVTNLSKIKHLSGGGLAYIIVLTVVIVVLTSISVSSSSRIVFIGWSLLTVVVITTCFPPLLTSFSNRRCPPFPPSAVRSVNTSGGGRVKSALCVSGNNVFVFVPAVALNTSYYYLFITLTPSAR